MKNYLLSSVLLLSFLSSYKSFSQISGIVFRDFNNNGSRQNTSGTFVEPGVKGIIINAYNSSDAIIASYVSDSVGVYSIPASGSTYNGVVGSKSGSVGSSVAVRLEFVVPSSSSCMSNKLYDFSSYLGSNYGTSIRFVNGGSTNVNFAINNPVDYVFDASPFSSTYIFLADHFSGNPSGGGSAASEIAFWKFPYNRSGSTIPSATSEKLATAVQIGTVYGVAYSRQAGRIFTSAYMKRHSGFGPANGTFNNAPGAIYMIDPTKNSSTPAASYFTSLDALGYPTHNSSGSPAYGSGTSYSISTSGSGFKQIQTVSYPSTAAQGVIGTNSNRGLAANITSPSNDPAAFGQVGTLSLGDIEISDDGLYLFVTNLYDRKIYQLQLNSATNPTSASYVTSWSLPNPPARSASGLPGASTTYSSSTDDFYNGTTGYQRPFALKYHKGKIYVGALTTGENGGTSITDNNAGNCEYSDLWAYVWELTPSSGFNSTPTLQFPLNYFRDINEDNIDETWRPWSRTTPRRNVVGNNDSTTGEYTYYPTAMFTDIEMDVDGSMILGFRDKMGDVAGNKNYLLTGTAEFIIPISIGDMLRAYKNPNTCSYELEENGKEGLNSPKAATTGKGNKEGPGSSSTTMTAANVTGGNQAWGSLGNISSEDGTSVSTSALTSGQTTQNLRITNLGLKVNTAFASGATTTILGIKARVVRKSSDASSITDSSIRLVKGGNPVGTNKADLSTGWPTSISSSSYGTGTTDLWGTTWTAAEVNSSNFGINIKARRTANSPVPTIDYVEIAVYYRISVTMYGVTTTNDYVVYSSSANAGEFYYQDGVDIWNGNTSVGTRWHSNNGLGSFAFLPGTEEVTSTHGEAETLNSGGISWMNNNSGANTRDYRIQNVTSLGGDAKTGGLGDLELFGQSPPVEIGNRIWNDANGDGIQTAGESGIGNISLVLYADFNADCIPDSVDGGSGNQVNDPTAYSGSTGSGTESWTSSSNTGTEDGNVATTSNNLSSNEITEDLKVTDFDFSIPSNATITGITSRIKRRSTGSNDIEDEVLQLVKAGSAVGTNKASGTNWPTSLTFASYGTGTTDLWGTSWTPAQINASDFGILLSAQRIDDAAKPEVDYIEITVYYTTPAYPYPLATTTTSSSGTIGEWYFNSSNVTDGDITTDGNQAGLVTNKNYIVRLDTSTGKDWDASANGGAGGPRSGQQLAGFQLTSSNKVGNGESDLSDNDAAFSDAIPQICLTTGNAGENNHSYDFGFDPLAKIGDKVWRDDNEDGVQDSGEPGVAGVTVTLYKNGSDGNPGTSDDAVIASTVTDAYGNYYFDNLTITDQTSSTTINQTSYNLGFTLPANYQFTTASSPGDNGSNTNSDANALSGRTSGYNLTAGECDLTVDAGIVFTSPNTASVGDYVWYDIDADGVQDSGEPGVSNVTVTLLNSAGTTIIASTITDVYGYYLFNNVAPATYRIGFSLPPGTSFTTNTGGVSTAGNSDAITSAGSTFGKTGTFAVASGEAITYVDAGIKSQSTTLSSIGDRVWYDNDRDGIQDVDEVGISGVTVTLRSSVGGTILATTTTNTYGYYVFNNLTPGNYSIKFEKPSGLTITSKNTGSSGLLDSDGDISTGNAILYTLIAGEKNMTIDCGMYSNSTAASVGALGDFVWNDMDGDNIQDSGEPGVAGITVILYNSSSIAIDTTSTDKSGFYLFPNLTPANYNVGFSNLLPAYKFTTQDVGGNDAVDSDANTITGKTAQVAVTGGTTNSSLDAGIIQGTPSGLGSLGNKVWYDLPVTTGGTDGNGVQDAGELGVAGVTIELLDGTGASIDPDGAGSLTKTTTMTDALGEYMFTGLNSGSYVVQFSNIPSGFTLTTGNSGSNDLIDSDGEALGSGGAPSGASRTGVYNLAQGEDNLTVDLGIRPAASKNTLGNYVWFDANGDGIQDANETGVPGVSVVLYNSGGTSIATTTTNQNGLYLFAGLSDAIYSVGFYNLPDGFNFTSASATNDATGSDADNTSGKTIQVTLGSTNRNDMSLDAGLITSRAALGNYVWNDSDKDGIQDSGEPGIAGVTVTLYDGSGSAILASAITNENGLYLFPNLTSASYVVGFTTLPSMAFTINDVSTETLGTDSDADPATGKTSAIALGSSEINLRIDAGVAVEIPARIGNFVWSDNDNDGVQDAGEQGVPGVLVVLYNSSNVPIGSSVTDGNGYWQITNVPSGSNYYLVFTSNLPNFDVTGTPGTNSAWAQQNIGTNATQSLSSGTESDTDSDVIVAGASAGKTGTFNIIPGNNFQNMDAGIINSDEFTPLPVTWLYFKATLVNKGVDVLLDWATAAEINNSHFEVQRSFDAVNFETIGAVKSKALSGQSTINLYYNMIDFEVAKHNVDVIFYRIKQIDFDGKFDFTRIESIHLKDATGISVYPNPVDEDLIVSLNPADFDEKVFITVSDIAGKVVFEKVYLFQFKGQSEEVISLKNLDKGYYNVTISDSKTTQTFKIMKY